MRFAVLISVALFMPAALASAPAAAQDIATGQILFNQRCSFCHSLTRKSRNTTTIPLQRPEDMLNDPENPGHVRAPAGQRQTYPHSGRGPTSAAY